MKRNRIWLFLLICLSLSTFSQEHTSVLPIIPKPNYCKLSNGNFKLTPETRLVVLSNDSIIKKDVALFNEYLFSQYGFRLSSEARNEGNQNAILIDKPTILDGDINVNAYSLRISQDHITIHFYDYGGNYYQGNGCFYALQTLIQLLPTQKSNSLVIPCAEINDEPRFQWRGMHLDVCRHFYPVSFIKKYIDLIALYKMNTFHWHLTEDQGWRIVIKKYPKLTQVGAWRKGTMVGPYSDQKYDSIPYGGFYTQEEIKDIVAYAAQRHVTIVPEIEMPGHSVAALASYPWLSCKGEKIEVERGWGVFEDVYCTKDTVFNFLQDVLDEVMALFPGKYIHIGGDECPKTRWKECKHCQMMIKRHKLKDEHELQSYFIQRIEKYVNSKGKQIIGWDEILEGGLAPNAAVMSWRGTEGGVTAAKQKHFVVMSPGSHCYFDHYQASPSDEPLAIGGYTPLEKVYAYEPIPKELKTEEQHYILGAQANVWTEYILNEKQVEYMALPRMSALAEVLWTKPENKSETDFLNRLQKHFLLLDKWNVNYAKALYKVDQKVTSSDKSNEVKLELKANPVLGDIYYTNDGKEPTTNSYKYESGIALSNDQTIKAALFKDNMLKGKVSSKSYLIHKAVGKRVTLKVAPSKSYKGDEEFTLVNGVVGTRPRINEQWLGWQGKDMEAVINLDEVASLSEITVGFLKDELNWIYLPKEIEFLVSTDGVTFISIAKIGSGNFDQEHFASARFKLRKAKYVKVIAKNFGKIPSGKPGAGSDSWLFCDEIIVK